jgi:hypothetical protein
MSDAPEQRVLVAGEHSSGRRPMRRRLWRLFRIMAMALLILYLSYPRFEKWLYMFRAYVYPKYPGGEVPPPIGKEGRGMMWNSDGSLKGMYYGKGVATPDGSGFEGQVIFWHQTGQVQSVFQRKGLVFHDSIVQWSRDGRIKSCFRVVDDEDTDGVIFHPKLGMVVFRDGELYDGFFLNEDGTTGERRAGEDRE